ncbi:MAG: hypothetical protein ACP5G1_04735, partial [Nanopusillaceae archaeon]
GQLNYNGVSCDIWWINISQGIPANFFGAVYMYINSTNTNYYQKYYPYVGASYNVLGTFQYDNIGYVMNPGLMYQIYVNYNTYAFPNQNNWPQVYSLSLANGACGNIGGITYCANWSVNINGSLPSSGTTQNLVTTVSSSIEPYVEIDWYYTCSGISNYPNPPINATSPAGVSESSYGWIIKFIGFAEVQQSNTNVSVNDDDGANVEYSQFPMINTGFYNWTTNNPNFVIQAFHGAAGYNTGPVPIGDYAFEYDYYEGDGCAATTLWSNNQVYYYSPAFPPNGVMPSISIISNVVQINITNTQSTGTPVPFQQDIAICNGTPSVGN